MSSASLPSPWRATLETDEDLKRKALQLTKVQPREKRWPESRGRCQEEAELVLTMSYRVNAEIILRRSTSERGLQFMYTLRAFRVFKEIRMKLKPRGRFAVQINVAVYMWRTPITKTPAAIRMDKQL
jgi:hypothetical protein